MKNYSRLIQKYAQVMLPPAPEKGVAMPLLPSNKAPDVDAIQREQLKRVEEIESAKEEGSSAAQALKMKHIDEMLQALEEGGEDAFFGTRNDNNSVILPPSDFEDEEPIIPVQKPLSEIKEPTEKEMEEWERWLRNMHKNKEVMKDIPQTGGISDSEEGTIRPGARNASAVDKLLSKCAFYYKLSTE